MSDGTYGSVAEERRAMRVLMWIAAAIAIPLLVTGVALWEPIGRAFALGYTPRGLQVVLASAWFAMCALTLMPRQAYGGVLLFGSIFALPAMLSFSSAGSYEMLGVGLLMFTAAGALIMLMAHISTETRDRRPWLEEAWPGIATVAISLVLVLVAITRTEPRIHYVPPTMLPAERGP